MHNLVSFLIVVTAISVVLATGIVLWFYAQHQTNGSRRRLKLELRNDGNVPGRYELKAEDPTGSLRFRWGINGSPLGLRHVPWVVNAPQLSAPAASPAKPASGDSLDQRADARKSVSGTVAEMLMTRMNPMRAKGPVYAVGSGQAAFVPSGMPSVAASLAPAAAVSVTGACAHTPAIPPGGALILDLTIEPDRAQHFQQYTFRVTSRSIEQPELLVTENGSVSIAGVSTLRRLLPLVMFVAVALLTVACTSFLLSSPRIVGG